MKRTWPLAALALLVLAPPALTAQDRMVRIFSSRARIGIQVQMRADADQDKIGATVAGVIEDGPADQAGIKEGDIITRFNGTALGGLKADDDDQSGPGSKLIELAHKLEPGDTVKLEYRRDGASQSATVVAEKASNLGVYGWNFRAPEGRSFSFTEPPRMEWPRPDGPDAGGFRFFEGPRGGFRFSLGAPGGLDLTDMNAGLGEYFGTQTGALVLDNPGEKVTPLKAGDVILAIDGREVRSAGQARRILGSYEPGETAKLDIMRQKRKQTVTWTLPEPGSHDGARTKVRPRRGASERT